MKSENSAISVLSVYDSAADAEPAGQTLWNLTEMTFYDFIKGISTARHISTLDTICHLTYLKTILGMKWNSLSSLI